MNILLIFLIVFNFSLLSQNKNYPNNTDKFITSNLPLTLSLVQEYDRNGFDLYPRGFFNENLDFSNSGNTFNSILKLTGEVTVGGLTGYGCAILFKNIFETDITKGENWMGLFWQAAITVFGAAAGTSGGTFLFGNILGDEGSFQNTMWWSLISAGIFNVISAAITKNNNDRLLITFIGFPIGAAIGFNSHEFF